MKRKFFYNTLFILLSLLLSCEKENTEPDLEKYEMNYIVRLEGDVNVTSVTMSTYTYYPNEDISTYMTTGKHRHEWYLGTDYYLYPHDSLLIRPDRNVYKGCERYLSVRFWFNEDKDTITYRDYKFGIDTILKKEDSKLIMVWPKDSAIIDYYEHSYWIKK